MSSPISGPDLTQRAPRSPRQRLGGFVILPRILDKGRAKLIDKIGPYFYASGLDKRFFTFVGLDSEALLEQLKTGKGDGEILTWIVENAENKRADWEIAQWSAFQEARTADSIKAKESVVAQITALNKDRRDILTGFDLLDLDDYVTFGGKA